VSPPQAATDVASNPTRTVAEQTQLIAVFHDDGSYRQIEPVRIEPEDETKVQATF
jgi:hypothetical protein